MRPLGLIWLPVAWLEHDATTLRTLAHGEGHVLI